MNEVFFQFQKSDLKIMEIFISLFLFSVYFIPEYMCAHTCYILILFVLLILILFVLHTI